MLIIGTGTHKVNQVLVTNLDQSGNFSLELLCQLIFASVLAIVEELELLHSDIILFIDSLEDVRTCTSTNLLLNLDIRDVDTEVVRASLKLLF